MTLAVGVGANWFVSLVFAIISSDRRSHKVSERRAITLALTQYLLEGFQLKYFNRFRGSEGYEQM